MLSFILALPSLGSSVTFSAAMSIATIGLYISYGIYPPLPLDAVNNCDATGRDSDRAARGLCGPICAWVIPSRPVLARSSGCRSALDRVHIGRVLST
jgi:hypothetical protein